jgi:hypothetical protein
MKSKSLKLGYFLTLVVVAVVWRWVPHPAGMAPMLPLALFLGAAAPALPTLLVVLGAQALSDAFIEVDITWPAVYFSLVLVLALGALTRTMTLKNRQGLAAVPALSILSSLIFFVITNAAVWAWTMMYPHTADGLWLAYVAGLPFLKNGLASDLLLSMVFFSIWHFVIVGQAKESQARVSG